MWSKYSPIHLDLGPPDSRQLVDFHNVSFVISPGILPPLNQRQDTNDLLLIETEESQPQPPPRPATFFLFYEL